MLPILFLWDTETPVDTHQKKAVIALFISVKQTSEQGRLSRINSSIK